MQVPLDITYRNVPKTDATESLIYEKVAKLEPQPSRIPHPLLWQGGVSDGQDITVLIG